MKNKSIVFTGILLVASIGNYIRLFNSSTIRMVEFVSIFAIGALAGVLLVQIIKGLKNNGNK
ncbi:MAG: hypothetical protein V4608_00250 [Bacteroidota bacterium]